MTKSDDFSGTWSLCYWYPSNDHEGEDPSEYKGSITKKGDTLIFESTPNKDENYMFCRLTLDGDLATGVWQEKSSPHGFYKGMEYSGAGQLLIGEDMKFSGMWAGIGLDREINKPKIYTGRWEIRKGI